MRRRRMQYPPWTVGPAGWGRRLLDGGTASYVYWRSKMRGPGERRKDAPEASADGKVAPELAQQLIVVAVGEAGELRDQLPERGLLEIGRKARRAKPDLAARIHREGAERSQLMVELEQPLVERLGTVLGHAEDREARMDDGIALVLGAADDGDV